MRVKKEIFNYAAVFWLMATHHARAALPDVSYAFPKINFAGSGSAALNYNPSTELISVMAAPTTIQFAPAEPPIVISGPKALQIDALVDNSGMLMNRVSGGDFVLSGTIIRNSGGISSSYSGSLLTGQILGFDFHDSAQIDQFSFLFQPTGGALLGFFNESVVLVTSEVSTFDGSFMAAFRGSVNGVVSSTVVPEPSLPSLFSGIIGLALMLRRIGYPRS